MKPQISLTLILLLACAAVGAAVGAGCRPEAPVSARKISASQARAVMAEFADFMLLDVRTGPEFAAGRIAGAVLIPHTEIAGRAAGLPPDPATTILVYCRTGRRSAIAAADLVRMGRTNVYDFGGIEDWPYGIVRD